METSPDWRINGSLESCTAIVLRRTRFSDSSLIISWLTAPYGRIRTLAKGALRPKNRFLGTLDLFYSCDIAFGRSAKSELHALLESSLVDAREGLRTDFSRVALASYFTELIEMVTESDHPAPEIHDLLTRGLNYLNAQPGSRHAMIHFEREITRLLGIADPRTSAAICLGRTYHALPGSRASLFETLP